MSDSSATEKPPKSVPAPRSTKYIVTLDNTTGLVLKVEKINEEAGTDQPATTTVVDPASLSTTFTAAAADPTAIAQAYYRGVADYLNALMTIK